MFTNQTNTPGGGRSSLHPVLEVLGGIFIGIVATYCFLFYREILDGTHSFQPATLRGLLVIGLFVLAGSWWSKKTA